jgi:hypothetical protein
MDEHEETRARRVSNGTQDLAPVGAVVGGVVLVACSTFCRRLDNVAPPMSCGMLLQVICDCGASGCDVFGRVVSLLQLAGGTRRVFDCLHALLLGMWA